MIRTLLLSIVLSLVSIGAAQAAGYRGYVARDHVVPKNTPRDKLPTIVRWTDGAGTHHQTHLEAGHLSGLLGEIRRAGGSVAAVDKALPGNRFVPAFGGDY